MDAQSLEIERDVKARIAGAICIAELGLGALLHGLRVPLTGTFLSLNQIFFLARAARFCRHGEGARRQSAEISLAVAVLKSLAPAGKKLTPMLAIIFQGLLFQLGLNLTACSLPGFFIGASLASLWSFVQASIVYLLIFGQTLIELGHYFSEKLGEISPFLNVDLWTLVLTVAASKVVLSWLVVILAFTISEQRLDRWVFALSHAGARTTRRPRNQGPAYWLALQDLCQPLTLLTWLACLVLLVFHQKADIVSTVLFACRTVLVAYAIFFLVRYVDPERFRFYLSKGGMPRVGELVSDALKILQREDARPPK